MHILSSTIFIVACTAISPAARDLAATLPSLQLIVDPGVKRMAELMEAA
jgi:hypothetical protein